MAIGVLQAEAPPGSDSGSSGHKVTARWALTQAVTQLRYGTVAVNVLAVGIPPATWGGYPGHPDTDIQSGRGVIGNALMLPDPERTVISAPFRTRPTPVWFATQPGMLPAFRALPGFEAAPTIPKLAGLMGSALRHR